MSHKHSFMIDAECDCGLMISELVRNLTDENTHMLKTLKSTLDALHDLPRYLENQGNRALAQIAARELDRIANAIAKAKL